ncbi:conserved hypothetical protein [Methanolacinia petrolearia DSM 11571]|uniref:Serine aminopeptidase S33 domain-containing protein n=1 Tax=Methanolacinia petrolearia (strain DSM 11571 / OCM 486 / SEBR 4847) TaxID=679926 RepID=E1RHZ9_METP4|nr:acetylxylan esterase [Methanolacinia petrolearia]ADN35384.1 conserved hypothetical protein [Methanolacinia petrolearia DSM 11571]
MKPAVAYSILVLALIAGFVLCSGCTSDGTPTEAPGGTSAAVSYSLSDNGILSVESVDYSYSLGNVTNEGENDSVKVSEVRMIDGETEVYTLLAEPQNQNPLAGIVFAPGAGVSADSHLNRSVEYAESGIAFMVVDVRGNGGKTPGVALNFQNEYATAATGKTPQYYSIIFDLIAAKNYLKEIYGENFPVYVMGSSNGGRYAAIAAAIDPGFAGYFGVSTSGYEYEEGVNGADVDLFIRSINPDTYIADISPAETVIFHAPDDDIIEYQYGLDFFNKASEPKDFVAFNGTHGINDEVDAYIETLLAGS